MPAYRNVTEKACVSADLNNLRNLGMAVNLYLNENGYIPGEHWPSLLKSNYISTSNVFQSPFDKRRATQSPGAAPVSYDINVNLWGGSMFTIASAPHCILLAPLTADQDILRYISTVFEPSSPSPLSRESNGTGARGGTCWNGSAIPVLFSDLHSEVIPIGTFHSPLANPDQAHSISDIRWNE
jgi:hypothetical protein